MTGSKTRLHNGCKDVQGVAFILMLLVRYELMAALTMDPSKRNILGHGAFARSLADFLSVSSRGSATGRIDEIEMLFVAMLKRLNAVMATPAWVWQSTGRASKSRGNGSEKAAGTDVAW